LLGVGMGGGVWNDGGSATVTNCTLSDNLAQGGSDSDGSHITTPFLIVGTASGGAIGSGTFFATQTPSLAITASNLSDNNSQGGSNVIEAVPVFSNTADAGNGRGGAVGAVAGDVTISNSTIAGNTAAGGALFTDVKGSKTVETSGSTGIGGGIDDEYDLG